MKTEEVLFQKNGVRKAKSKGKEGYVWQSISLEIALIYAKENRHIKRKPVILKLDNKENTKHETV